MKNKIIIYLLVLFALNISIAQEKQNDELSYLFPEPKSWDFGVQVSAGIESVDYPNAATSDINDDLYGIGRLAFYSQYQLNTKSNLKMELAAGAFNRLAPTISFQYGYQFAPRWTAYGGIGLDIDFNNQPFSLERGSEQRVVNPRIQLGLRYHATNSLLLDLRYEQDILDRTRKQDLSNSMLKTKTLSLGVGIKF